MSNLQTNRWLKVPNPYQFQYFFKMAGSVKYVISIFH